jgi:hypothetical protein
MIVLEFAFGVVLTCRNFQSITAGNKESLIQKILQTAGMEPFRARNRTQALLYILLKPVLFAEIFSERET